MAGFRREPQESRAGRKIKPTRRVQDILCESLNVAIDEALQSMEEGERRVRLAMASRRTPEQVREEYLTCEADREEACRLLDEAKEYLPHDLYEAKLDIYLKIQSGFKSLENDAVEYSEQRDVVPGNPKLVSLMHQSQALAREIHEMEEKLAKSSLDLPAGTHYSSTPRTDVDPPRPPDLSGVPRTVPSTAQLNRRVGAETTASNVVTQPATDTTADVLNRLATILEQKQSSGRLPRIAPDIFKGDLTMFPAWWNAFETMVEARAHSDQERLFFLNQYTADKANECIKGFMGLSQDEGAYRRARHVLLARFGNRLKIAEAFKARLSAWGTIREGDGQALQSYADFLWQCHAAMDSLDYLTNLNCQEENNKMAVKLPKVVSERWDRIVDDAMYGDDPDMTEEPSGLIGHFPPFQDFCRFVGREARIMIGSCSKSSAARDGGKKKATALMTEAEPGSGKPPYACPFCKGPHFLYLCKTFLENTPDFKKNYARENAMCFGCLRRGHMYRTCKIRNPDILRDYSVEAKAPAKAKMTNLLTQAPPEGDISSAIVAVWCYLDELPESAGVRLAGRTVQRLLRVD